MAPLALRRVHAVWTTTPWLHYAAVYSIPMLFCLIDKLVALSAILDMYAADNERDGGRKFGGIVLGMCEDFILVTILLVLLLIVEAVRIPLSSLVKDQRALRMLGHALRALIVLVGVVGTLAFFAADMLLLRTRSMRFTTDLIDTYLREKDEAKGLEVDPREVRLARATVIGTAFVALFFTVFYMACVDLLWRHRPATTASSDNELKADDIATPAGEPKNVDFKSLEEGGGSSTASPVSQEESPAASKVDESYAPHAIDRKSLAEPATATPLWKNKKLWLIAVAIVAYIVFIVVVRAITKSASPVVSAIALNATLNELYRHFFNVQFQRGAGSGGLEAASYYLNSQTESYSLFENDVLYRKTTGFQGPLAFDVKVDDKNPPNVLVLAVESFRYMDSLLMAANTTAGELMQKNNLTVTPNFDKWASRGIAFNNMWSSWQTSRSLEAILFGQVAYDSVTDSGTTRGRKDTKLVGMPQFFKQKGYETVFTTGCIVTYDQWDTFLPSHGFESVMAAPDMKIYAQQHYNISKNDWDGPAKRGFNWGVHDDISFEIIGDMMINKTLAQAERVKRGEPKQPFFMNHYTISSHHTFEAHPTWLDSEKLPDFSPLCEGWEDECELIQKYAKLRYFTDMELGKFLDRMKKAGVLDDTILVIVGDHGQSPEFGLPMPYVYQTAVTHVASTLIAEGRLGEYAGMIFDDAVHHYDLLNTLADIVGVPKEGFLQTGVGRSLKRKIPFGERLVWSNNPMKKMSVVRGHQRYVYDRTASGVGLFDTIKDPLEKNDLLPALGAEEAAKYRVLRRKGRELNTYFKDRWDKKCLAQVSC